MFFKEASCIFVNCWDVLIILERLFAFMRLSRASFDHLILCYSFTNEWKHMQRHETLRSGRTEGFIEDEMWNFDLIHCGTCERSEIELILCCTSMLLYTDVCDGF